MRGDPHQPPLHSSTYRSFQLEGNLRCDFLQYRPPPPPTLLSSVSSVCRRIMQLPQSLPLFFLKCSLIFPRHQGYLCDIFSCLFPLRFHGFPSIVITRFLVLSSQYSRYAVYFRFLFLIIFNILRLSFPPKTDPALAAYHFFMKKYPLLHAQRGSILSVQDSLCAVPGILSVQYSLCAVSSLCSILSVKYPVSSLCSILSVQYPLCAVFSLCSILSVQYSLCAVSSLFSTDIFSVQYSLHAVSSLFSILSVQYPLCLAPASSLCSILSVQYPLCAVSSLCSILSV
jgi:hypothetical protein